MSHTKSLLAVLLVLLSACRSTSDRANDDQLDISTVLGIVTQGRRASTFASSLRIAAPSGTPTFAASQKTLVSEYNDIVLHHNQALELAATMVREPAPTTMDDAKYRSSLLGSLDRKEDGLVQRVNIFLRDVCANDAVVVAASDSAAAEAGAGMQPEVSIDQIVSEARRLTSPKIRSATQDDASEREARARCATQLLGLRLKPIQRFASEDSK